MSFRMSHGLEKYRSALEVLFLVVFSFLIPVPWVFQSPYLTEFDNYYHLKIAMLMRESGFFREFEWAQFGLWKDHFADKEILFHVLLIPFTYFEDKYFGMKLAGVGLVMGIVLSFYFVLKLNRIRAYLFWAILLPLFSHPFNIRLSSTRPHLLSIILILWCLHAILNRKKWLFFFLCFVYSWSYVASFLPVLFSAIIALHLFLVRKKKEWELCLYGAGGMLLGMVINPYFPDNFVIFYVQNFEVMWAALRRMGMLTMGVELAPVNGRDFLMGNLIFCIGHSICAYLSVSSLKRMGTKVEALFLVSLSMVLLTFISKRFIEYSAPLSLLYFAFFAHRYLVGKNILSWKAFILCLLLVRPIFSNYQKTLISVSFPKPLYKGGAEFMAMNVSADETIFTCSWDYTSQIFYFSHRHRYMAFLDPVFMYSWSPNIWRLWQILVGGELGGETDQVLRGEFGLRYGICPKFYDKLYRIAVANPRMEILYEDEHVYVFKVLEESGPATAGLEELHQELGVIGKAPANDLQLSHSANPRGFISRYLGDFEALLGGPGR